MKGSGPCNAALHLWCASYQKPWFHFPASKRLKDKVGNEGHLDHCNLKISYKSCIYFNGKNIQRSKKNIIMYTVHITCTAKMKNNKLFSCKKLY